MRIPEDAIIPDQKITLYLLVHKPRNDKSKFLAQAGFTQENPEALITAIRLVVAMGEAVEDMSNELFPSFFPSPSRRAAMGRMTGR